MKNYEYIISILGDVNGDGKINYLDYVTVYNHIYKSKHPESSKKLLENEYFLNSLKEIVVEIKGARMVLEKLSNKYKIVIATNGPKEAVYTKIDKIGCSEYVDYVFSADITKNKVTKPDEIYFNEMLEFLNYDDREKMLIVGDSLKTDIKGGMNSGIDSCWFNKDDELLMEGYKPSYIIKKLEELLEIL